MAFLGFAWWSIATTTVSITAAFSLRHGGRRELSAQLPLRVIGTPSSGPPLTHLAAKYSDLWDLRYTELTNCKNERGDCNVSQRQGSLGEWVVTQRKNYKKGKLSDERIARLKSIGFVWDPQEQQWLDRFDELTKYKAEEGDCNVQQSHGPLGEWVATQRKNYKKGDIADERIARLESIGFVWDQLEQQWSDRFDELTKYKARNGDCNVLQSQGPLGEWVVTQRKNYNKGDISDERIARLESIGFVWDPQEQQWSDRFDELAKYKAEQGDCNVPTYQGLLGEWVNTQRVSYKEGKMAQGRVDLLESVGFAWEPLDEAWMARFDELVDFKEENGDCNVPHAQGQLGKWVTTQRTSYKEEKLSQERIDFLENVGFEWVRMERTVTELPWKHDEQWKTKFTELVEYLIEHGSCHVPNRYGPLGWWVGTQRQDYKDGRMSQFRIDYLESIGFVWAMKRVGREAYPDQYSQPDPGAISRIVEEERPRHDDLPPSAPEALKARVNVGKRLAKALQEYLDNDSVRLIQTYEKPKKVDPRWKARYTELVHYLIEHGNCNVPRRFGPLGWWVGLQRQAYKEGSILQLRKEYLDSIGFVWTTKRVGGEWLPDEYSRPDPKTIARIIDDEKPRHEDLPSSAPKRLKMRVKADRDLVKALQEYLDKIETT